MLVGPAGAGKTTFARRHFAEDEIVSSDRLREEIAGDAADQSRNRAVFDAAHRTISRRLSAGQTCVVDATNVERHARRSLLLLATRHGVPAIAIVFDLPLDVALERNARRPDRRVPPDVVERHHRRLTQVLAKDRLDAEGFALVCRLVGADAIDTVLVHRPGRRRPSS